MVAGTKVAISLWARGGSNLLIQSHGLSARIVQEATREVAQTLGAFAAGRGRGNLDGSGDNAPAFALGQLKVMRGRFMVNYRLVNAIYIMVVTEPAANVFLCVQLLEAVAKILVATARGVDVTADKVARKYQEVYQLLDGLLDGGLAVLPPAFAHRSATADLLLTMPASATDAAHKLKKMINKGAEEIKKVGAEGDKDPTPPPVPETPATPGRQFAPEEVDPLAKVDFEIPHDALPPPPSRAAVARRPPPVAAVVVTSAPPAAFQGAVKTQEEIDAEAAAEAAAAAAAAAAALKAAGLTGAPEKPAEEGGWAEFGEEPVAVAAPVPPPVQEPEVSEADVRASLQLLEVWRAEFGSGGQLAQAGVEGCVRLKLAPYGLARARFRLRPAPSSLINACLRAALLNAQYAERRALGAGESGDAGFSAAIARAPVGCAYLKYRLPAVACAPPLQVQLHVLPGADAGPRGGKAMAPQLLVVLRYTANPQAPGALLDVVADVSLPPQVGALAKVSPSGQWAKDRCQLRWELGRVLPGQEGVLRAVVTGKAGVGPNALLAAVQQQAEARVLFTGQRGRTLSGLGFEAGFEKEGAALLPCGSQYFGEVTVRV